jgi:capsular exopolysaccharide synthesis family protein
VTPKVDKRARMAGAGVGAGLMLAVGTLLVIAKLRNRISDPEDLPDHMQQLVVGTVSNAALARGSHNAMRRKILSEEMRLVHANLLPPGKHERRIIMVTSPTPGNGKTSISSHLALSLAKSGLEVLLIDADMRKRDLSVMFDTGLGFRPGLAELLQGGTPELIKPVELLPNFKVMGAGGKLERNPAELFQRQHLREILDRLSEKYDVIIVDTPPTLVVADARLIARSCDEVICVVRAEVSSQKEINQTLDALSRVRGEMPKVIVNGVEHRSSYYKHKFAYTDGVAQATPHMDHGQDREGAKWE